MLTRDEIRPLAAALGSGTLVGLAMGLWMSLPAYLSQPAAAATEPVLVSQIDPNRALYDRMIADNGVNATPYVLAAGYAPVSDEASITAPADAPAGRIVDDTPASDSAAAPQFRRIALAAGQGEFATSSPAADGDQPSSIPVAAAADAGPPPNP